MSTTITIIEPDGSRQEQSHELPEAPGYKQLSAVLGPLFPEADFEHVSVLHHGRRADMFVDENGHAKGLPRNEAGTAIYRANALSHEPGTAPESLPFIVGRVVLFSRRVWF